MDRCVSQSIIIGFNGGFVVESRVPHLLVQVSQLPSGLLCFSCQLCGADLQHVCSTNRKDTHVDSHTLS